MIILNSAANNTSGGKPIWVEMKRKWNTGVLRSSFDDRFFQKQHKFNHCQMQGETLEMVIHFEEHNVWTEENPNKSTSIIACQGDKRLKKKLSKTVLIV